MFHIGYWIGYFVCWLLPSRFQERLYLSVEARWYSRPLPSQTTGFETGVITAWAKPRLKPKI
jgi:hypothetical protein